MEVQAQILIQTDTTGLYGERKDTLEQAVLAASSGGNFLSKVQPLRTEVISAAGLLKMACCNLQYATRMNKWIFDFTASLNGPCRVWDFMKGYEGRYEDGYTPAYPLLYAQVTKRFKGIDLYVGGENLTDYRQPFPILNAESPFSSDFDASCVWGPLMGIRVYAGIRITLWKTT